MRRQRHFETTLRVFLTTFGVLLVLTCTSSPLFAQSADEIDFNRDVRPILSAKCFACHGPDSENSDSALRLDTKEDAFADLGGYAAIVPGKLNSSELVSRILSTDESERMPPPEHKNPLNDEQINLLKQWIQQGAPFTGHWAFESLERPTVPAVKTDARNPIDNFIARRLEKEGLTMSEQADPATRFRRLHLDLTGLPPTLEALDAFLANPDEEAYEATIDRLMQTPAFAERLTSEWLDVARYADTNGYSIDDHRDMWGWRDWVIHAFQTNMPFDQFIRQQLAGDLMKDSTDQMKVATGFLRNSMNTHEGGTIAEEYRVAAIADKIDTVATAYMGLTMKCAQCHDHKYDPISQRDYYRFFAFFNTSGEPGNGAVNGNTKPILTVDPILPTADQFRQALKTRINSLVFLKLYPEELLGDARKQWETEQLLKLKQESNLAKKSIDESPQLSFNIPKPKQVKGLSWIWTNSKGTGEFAWFRKTFSLTKIPPQAHLYVTCDNEAEIWINGKRLGVNPDWRTPSVFDLQPHLVEGENVVAVAGKDWEKGKAKAALLALIAIPGKPYIVSDASWLVRDTKSKGWNQPGKQEGFRTASIVAPHGATPWGDTFQLFDKKTTAMFRPAFKEILLKPDSQRTQAEQFLVIKEFAKSNSDMSKLLNAINGEIDIIRKSLDSGKTTVMVMDQSAQNRKTPILIRGQYDQHGDVVDPGVPKFFSEPDRLKISDRLALAKWLTDPQHPLTARVTVNRYWQMLFGTGLVRTAEDFGSQGEYPSHPELLDWLASEFIASGWDVRFLLKTMLMSRTYQQSSATNALMLERDPTNRLLGRAPRFRLAAESLRDSALALGGLLDRTVGGPSVFPPQPGGLWKEVSHFGHPTFFTAQHFFRDRNDAQVFRRSLYTFWKRTSPPSVMQTFDAPSRETCSVRRSLTNTPLQALVLMNEPQFVAAAHGLAARLMNAHDDVDQQIRTGFRMATARQPTQFEFEILQRAYQRQLEYFQSNPKGTMEFIGQQNPAKAALSSVASLILNMDETITRE